MGFLWLITFSFNCIQVLGWPIFALGYPLYASIQALEANSDYQMRNLVTYWILFSIISLFELAFVKLIEWMPFWPFVKIATICWLVLSHFTSAYDAYNWLVRPLLSVNLLESLQVVINWLKKKQELSLKKEMFLAVAERYVIENGNEALEKLIASKSKWKEHSTAQTDINNVEHIEEIVAHANTVEHIKENVAATEKSVKHVDTDLCQTQQKFGTAMASKWEEHSIAQTAINNVEHIEEIVANANTVEHIKENLAATEKRVKHVDNIREYVQPVPPALRIQKEWTCAVCQIKTPSDVHLNSHLQGRKHRSKCEELKASKRAVKEKDFTSTASSKSDQTYQHPKKTVSGDRVDRNTTQKAEENVQVNVNNEQEKPRKSENANAVSEESTFRCDICNVSCPCEISLASHLNGRKHLKNWRKHLKKLFLIKDSDSILGMPNFGFAIDA